ncbi:tetratricopeptide repeat protein [Acidovorax sp. ST3]|uniref:tetratricopeptide repeat protein n=1 Tax=Acidovorax sp. ST3 TaxID=2219062 RepID=UPI000DA66A0E|nr:tetratricopeptide repeat protein [Acidovorax sp. ST3]
MKTQPPASVVAENDPKKTPGELIAQLQSTDPALRQEAAVALAKQAKNDPRNALLQQGMGIADALAGRWEEGRKHFEQAVALEPRFASAWSNLGNIHKLQGRLKEARQAYDKAIALQPDLSDAHYNLALVAEAEGDLGASEASLRRALLFRPAYPEVHNNLGHLMLKAGKVEQAVSHFRQALVFNPALRPARNNLILSLYRLSRTQEAQSEVDRLLEQNPGDPQVLRIQAAGLAQLGRLADAEAINRQLLVQEPDAPDLQWNLGEVMLQRDDYEGAMACYRELLARPNIPTALALGAMGNVMLAQGNYSEARNLYQQALATDARHPSLLQGLARALLAAGETRQGLETLHRAVTLLPKADDVHSQYLLALRLDSACSEAMHAAEAQRWLKAHAPKSAAPLQHRLHKQGEALRVGLLVGDLEKGSVPAALAALMPVLDPHEIDLYVYHAARSGNAAQALQDIAPHWRPVSSLGDTDLVQQMREDGLDVLLDMIGHGPGGRLPALAQRAAPVQLGWLGEASEASLAIWDGTLDDQGSPAPLKAWPPWRPPADAPDVSPLPMLTMGHATLGVLAPLGHIQAETLDAWAEILRAQPSAHLLIVSQTAESDTATRQRIQRLLLLRDIEPDRVHIAHRLTAAEMWQAMARIDVVLDSFPQPMSAEVVLNCLWMGIPVITLHGRQPWQQRNRKLLAQIGLQEHAVSDVTRYVEQVVSLMHQPESLETLRAALRARLQHSPCMDTAAFARSLTATLKQRIAY